MDNRKEVRYGKLLEEIETLRCQFEDVVDEMHDTECYVEISNRMTKVCAELTEIVDRENARPLQPVALDDEGVLRFVENPIVTHLLDTHPTEGMNTLYSRFHGNPAAKWQFAQLIGYDTSSGGGLSFALQFQVAWTDKIEALGIENKRLEAKVEELETECGGLYLAMNEQTESLAAASTRSTKLEEERQRHYVSPSPFTLNPVAGTMGYLCILAEFDGDLDAWVLHDDGDHQGWVLASLVEPGEEVRKG